MKIYIDTLVFGLQKMGGVSVYWLEVIPRLLNNQKFEVTLINIKRDYVNENYKALDKSKADHIVERLNNLQLARNFPPYINEREDLVIFHSTYLRTLKKRNVINVITIHDFTHQKYFFGLKKWLNTRQKIKAIKNADGIICISNSTKSDLYKFDSSVRSKPIKVIYNGVSKDYFETSESIPEKYADNTRNNYFIYVGDRFEYKNFKFLIEIIKRQQKVDCILIGGGELTQEESLALGKDKDRIHQYTGVSNEDLNILYNNARCLVFPSYYEGFWYAHLGSNEVGVSSYCF